nr:hypothetical protein BaRGS_033079 [Batillaria attramentaria]
MVISNDFQHKWKRAERKRPDQVFQNLRIVGKLHCRGCSFDWGCLARYIPTEKEFPVIKLDSFILENRRTGYKIPKKRLTDIIIFIDTDCSGKSCAIADPRLERNMTQGQAVHLKELQELEEQDSTMIYKLLSNEEVVELKKELRHDLPGSAKMFYILSNFLQGLMAGFEVIVDHWPNWQCIILRPESPDAVPSYFRHYNICHTRSVKAFRFFIQRPCVIDWNKPVCFTGVPYDALPTLQEQSRKHGGRLSSVENRFMYAWTKSEPPEELPVPEGYTLTRLTAKDAPALCERWKHYRPDPALDLYMQVITEQFDSSAIVTKEGQLVAYIGMQFNGAMAMLHVDPNYRGRGLGQIVLVDLTRKLLAKGNTAYGLIPTKDTSFIATSSQKLGFTWVPQGSMAWARPGNYGTCGAGHVIIHIWVLMLMVKVKVKVKVPFLGAPDKVHYT